MYLKHWDVFECILMEFEILKCIWKYLDVIWVIKMYLNALRIHSWCLYFFVGCFHFIENAFRFLIVQTQYFESFFLLFLYSKKCRWVKSAEKWSKLCGLTNYTGLRRNLLKPSWLRMWRLQESLEAAFTQHLARSWHCLS